MVAVADTGFDTGDAANPHPAFTGRVQALYALGRTAPDKADDPHGHGTHVAGSVLGRGNSATMGGDIEGTAPEAQLILQSVLDSNGGLGGIPVNLNDLFQKTYDDGARVHTNSWGVPGLNLPYDASSREIDEFVWNHQDQVICFAAGNDGVDGNSDGTVDSNSIGSQSAAKNCITVGASESLRKEFAPSYGTYWPGDFPANPVKRDKQANNPDGMVAFSSRGPTKEGRIKPDVVAPGTSILSTLSRNAPMGNTFGTSTDPLFFFDSGTSMATPLVAGCAAVLRETLVKNGLAAPSAALIKALLINGADVLPGQYNPSEAGESPNGNSGWGRVEPVAGPWSFPGSPAMRAWAKGARWSRGRRTPSPSTSPRRSPRLSPRRSGTAARPGTRNSPRPVRRSRSRSCGPIRPARSCRTTSTSLCSPPTAASGTAIRAPPPASTAGTTWNRCSGRACRRARPRSSSGRSGSPSSRSPTPTCGGCPNIDVEPEPRHP